MRGEQKNQTSSFSKSRALGVIVLVLGLFLFQIAVFVFEKREQQPAENLDIVGTDSVQISVKEKSGMGLFKFNPNTISADSLCLLGFSVRQAQSIIKYRQKGGIFRKKEDFSRMYVVSEEMYNKLSDYIVVKGECAADVEKREGARELRPRKQEQEQKQKQKKRSGDTLARRQSVIELNSADSASLVTLYGIGGYYAKKILGYRARVGNFYAPEQLMEIEGIDSVRYLGFADRVKADPISVKKFSLDTAGKYFLIRHPYIGAYAARGIILMREKFGPEACSLENLVKERIITPEAAKKLWYYVE